MNSTHTPEIATLAKVLVVDDNLAVQRTVRRALTDAGYLVTVAENGTAAMRVLACWSADLVITDILMPDRDGYELIRAIRDRPGPKIIAMSARTRMGAMDTLDVARKLGAHRILEKPFTPDRLRACVADCLADRSGAFSVHAGGAMSA